jgi:hypothetical protein
MSGIEIYNEYQKKRDYSGSESDQYAQDLETMYNSCYQNGEESILSFSFNLVGIA